MISTSDYDVRQAIEYFDKSQQRALEEMRLQEQQQANALAMEQNDLLDRRKPGGTPTSLRQWAPCSGTIPTRPSKSGWRNKQ